jgi:hypothetical protein
LTRASPRSISFAADRPACRRQHDIGGLQVAVDDAGGVECMDGAGDLDPERRHVAPGQRPACDADGQRLAVQVLERHIRLPLRRLAHVHRTDDPGVLQVAEDDPLHAEASRGLGAARPEDLDRHGALARLVLGQEHVPMPPFAIRRTIR